MSFKIHYSYKLRDIRPQATISAPVGTFEEFKDKVTKALEYYGHKEDFKFSAEFTGE